MNYPAPANGSIDIVSMVTNNIAVNNVVSPVSNETTVVDIVIFAAKSSGTEKWQEH